MLNWAIWQPMPSRWIGRLDWTGPLTFFFVEIPPLCPSVNLGSLSTGTESLDRTGPHAFFSSKRPNLPGS
ncbi:hypothetical protein DSM3645_18371 [Blastopirellula marina DSM 3645]|uniref:Uncharacterized protein n=1 Tax=Blastopirellula marina DSM 3645 TaxID=314230 RepID=A3ZYW8_9BACT|nr:hypothetical protein DSM3645_18371 [Blastopirellula marina DSM 3645]